MEVSSTVLGAAFLGMAALVIGLILIIRNSLAQKSAQGLGEKYKSTTSAADLEVRNKYPEADVFRLSPTFFNLGLAISVGITVLALGWTQYEKTVDVSSYMDTLEEEIEVEPPRTAEPPPPPPPPPPPVIQEVPDETVIEDQPEFVDQSMDEEVVQEAPKAVENKPAPPPPPPPPPPAPEEDEIFKVVEEMPRFPGCENEATTEAKKACADKKMLEFIYKNIKYPAIARENGVEGTAVITFVVEKDGTVKEARIVRDIGAQCGQEALRVVNMMNESNLKWTPGKQRGRSVRVQFNLPVRFKLE
jgi:periplasmic protein TonB